jgi:hypothetical protein
MRAVFLTITLFSTYLRIILSETDIRLRRIFVILDFLSLSDLPNESCVQISDVLSALLFCCFLCLSTPPPTFGLYTQSYRFFTVSDFCSAFDKGNYENT